MIHRMNKRVVGVVALLGLALVAGSRPAHAQDGDSWFDDSATDAPPAPPPAAAPAAPPAPPPAPAPAPPPASPPQALPPAPPPQALPPAPAPQGQQSAPVPQPVAASAPALPGPQPPQSPDNVPETDPRAITEFRPTLDPYGTWVNDARYGTVWVPNRDVVGADFAPYVSAGHWALTVDNDWIWQSDYPFGGVVFHYGRWVWVPNVGWGWVAGRRYANAWVTWRVPTDDYAYIGWAPMAPAWGWYGGVAVSLWWYPPSAYVFCPSRYAFSYHVHSYVVHDHHMVHDIAGHTRNYSGGAAHAAASPRVLPANSMAPRGPSLQHAHVPAFAAPMTRVPTRSGFSSRPVPAVPPVPYGAEASRRSFSSGARPLNPAVASSSIRPAAIRNYRASSFANPSMYARRPALTAPLASGSRSAPSLSGRSLSMPSTPSGSPSTRYFSSGSRAPSFSAPSRSYSAPSFHSAPSFNSAPARSAPSFHSAPSPRSFHAPSRR
ncbi:MAG TPA: DUF6600 domain-containing protein [Polyangiaceae bacterium]|nr:DUF6600 domain-containing protein [Polyangiaceae bacterium]